MSGRRDTFGRWAPSTLMVASGMACLGYQIIWTQQCSLWLGHDAAAVLAVVAAFFGGLALGGLLLGGRIERSTRPLRWYAGCELSIALWALVLLGLGPSFGRWLQRAIGVEPTAAWHWLVAFLGTFVLLLPATAAMGATLPAMERLTAQLQSRGRSITVLYAASTLGAVLGVLVACFFAIPRWGLSWSAAGCVGLNLTCAALSLRVFPNTAQTEAAATPERGRSFGVMARLAATGFLGIGYEVLVVRVLSQVTENTVYTFALVLAVYLAGTALGAAGYRRWLEVRGDAKQVRDQLLTALGAACLVGSLSLWLAEGVKSALLAVLGASFEAAMAAEALLGLLAFGPPTLLMGAVFSHLSRSALAAGVGLGRALGINLLAAAMAPALCGVVAVPLLGPRLALLLVALGYLALTARSAWSRPFVWFPAATALALAVFAPPLRFVAVPDGGRLVSHREGVMAAVSVVEDAGGVARLHINNRQQEGSSGTRHVDARQAWLPLLLHAEPGRALFLGLGTGVTASSAAEDPTLDVDVVELLPEVIAASKHFGVRSAEGAAQGRPRVVAADARRFVRASAGRYDVIVSDNFHPARSGSGALYTVEHFDAVRARLAEGGLFCQWLPLHQLDLLSLRSIVRSFVTVYPGGWALLASNSLETPVLGLVARAERGPFDLARVRARLSRLAMAPWLSGLGLEDELALLGSFVAGPSALASFASDVPANTDDHPLVTYRAPRITYAPDSRPRDRLFSVLGELVIEPTELVRPTPDGIGPRLSAYWAARHRYLESGREVRPSARVEDMLAQVESPLLAVLRTSPDFRPAYDPLLKMAAALGRSNVSRARALLGELHRLQPARGEASQLLEQMGADAAVADRVRR